MKKECAFMHQGCFEKNNLTGYVRLAKKVQSNESGQKQAFCKIF